MTSDSSRRRGSGIRLPLWLLGLLLVLGLILLVGSSVWLFRTVRDLASAGEISDPDFSGLVEDQSLATPQPGDSIADNNADNSGAPLDAEAIEPWTGTDKVTMLLLGVDRRCDEEGPTHSDTIILATLDPATKSAAVLSFPRDLWVEIPGFGVDRINQAYFLGQAYELPGGGAALAEATVEAFFGVPIDYYVTVDFQAFVEAVDLIGGVVVDVPEAINDPTYPDNCYGYDPFYIDAGRHRLDGAMALKFARTRATFGGDVDRAGRQQQVILAVRDQVKQLNNLPQLLLRAPQLWQAYQDNVTTNLTLEQAIQLGLLAQEIDPANIRNVVLNYDYVYNETTPDGQQILVPVREKIRSLRDELFAPPAVPTPAFESLPELMAAENARVAVYNGTAEFGLAAATQEYLRKLNVNVSEIGNADSSSYTSTQIIDYGSHPNTVLFLIQQMQIPPLNVSTGSAPAGDFDVLVILGSDWQAP